MKEILKRATLFLMACTMMFSLVACGSQPAGSNQAGSNQSSSSAQSGSDGQVYQLSIASPTGEKVINHFLAQCVKEILEEKSNGRIQVTIYPNAQLGTTSEEIQGIINGTINSGSIMSLLYTPFVPQSAVLDMYNLFDSLDECRAIVDGPVLTELQKAYEAKGMKLFGMADSGWCYVSSNKKITQMSDFKGLKLRVVENPVVLNYWSLMGCNPTPVDYSELYIALQQGTVDGQENALDSIYGDGFYEVQKYLINIHHRVTQIPFVMNLDYYNSLPDDLKAICDEWIPVACDNARKVTDDYASEVKQKLTDAGLEFIDFDDTEMVKVQTTAQKSYDLVRQTAGDDIVDLMLSEVSNYNATH